MNRQVFEIMLKAAVEEDFEQELQELSKAEEFADDCELSQTAQSKIEKMIGKAYRHSVRLRVEKAAKRAAIILAIILPVSLGSLLSVEASRNAIFNALLDWKSDHVDIHYRDGEASSHPAVAASGASAVKPQYLPKGFVEAKSVQNGSDLITEYRNSSGRRIRLRESPLTKEGTLAVDTEHTTRKEVKIQGEEALLFAASASGETSYLAWKSHFHSFLLSSEIPSEELIKIAESITE